MAYVRYDPRLTKEDNRFVPMYTGNDVCESASYFLCTRKKNHDGPHVAHTDENHIIATWEDQDQAFPW